MRCPQCGHVMERGQKDPNPDPETKALFDRFWEVYPKRGGHSNPKKEALRRFCELLGEGEDAELLVRRAEEYAEWCRVKGWNRTSFVKQAAAWLFSRRWEDSDFTIGWHMLADVRDEAERDAVSANIEAYLAKPSFPI